jgi:hypothetical protein
MGVGDIRSSLMTTYICPCANGPGLGQKTINKKYLYNCRKQKQNSSLLGKHFGGCFGNHIPN